MRYTERKRDWARNEEKREIESVRNIERDKEIKKRNWKKDMEKKEINVCDIEDWKCVVCVGIG